MKRRWWLASIVVALAGVLPAYATSQGRRAKVAAPTLRLIATCDGIQATGKRRQSWIFQLKVLSVIEGHYEEPFIGFELFQGGRTGGEQLLAIVGAKGNVGRGNIADFDRRKKLELTFEPRSSKSIQGLELRSFRNID